MNFENRYNWSDKLLHKVAFSSGKVQTALADIEDKLYGKELQGINANRPVFVTALPRAGTTILLNLLAVTGEFASHRYRNMPFVLCPMLWNGFSKNFQVDDTERERAHGDGLKISANSPEAFEEMIWRAFWKSHYKRDRITTWKTCDDAEFLKFLRNHFRKIVYLNRTEKISPSRYLSKNNMNIARLQAIASAFPDGLILVPFRDPLQHALSLLNQHLRFKEIHQTDPFTKIYMEGLGHYDFGENFRPINFDDWLDGDRREEAKTLAFWLEYWLAAHHHILSNLGPCMRLVSYKKITESPVPTLEWLASEIHLSQPESLTGQANTLKLPRTHNVDISRVPEKLVDKVYKIYEEIIADSGIR